MNNYTVATYPATSQAVIEAPPQDILEGLTSTPKRLSPKYFYDSVGSALFERITRLPEYYPTRTERKILAEIGQDLMDRVRPEEIVELGSGYALKIRTLLGMHRAPDYLKRYVPFDVDDETVEMAVETIVKLFPYLDVQGVAGDFNENLDRIPVSTGRRMSVFFGSTIGNFDPPERHEFLTKVHALLGTDDFFLLGVDLAKDRRTLETAYNDAEGVTAEFNRNMLRVVNHTVNADFDTDAFEHFAFFNEADSRIEMHLVAKSDQTVHLGAYDTTITTEPGQTIWTENSYKFTRDSASIMLSDAGFEIDQWHTDEDEMFAVILATPVV